MTGFDVVKLAALAGIALHAVASLAGAPLVPCRGASPEHWTVGVASSPNVCVQSLLHGDGVFLDHDMDPLGSQPSGDGLTAAMAGREIVAIREWHPLGPPPRPDDWLVDFSRAGVVESGHVGSPGELWWGRISSGPLRCCKVGAASEQAIPANSYNAASQGESLFFAIGQETRIRQGQGLTSPTQIMAMMNGKLGPWPTGARALHFEQLAATALVSHTSSPVPPGAITQASLDLDVEGGLQGTLTLSLAIDGETGTLAVPLKRDVEEAQAARMRVGLPGHPWRIRQGRQAEGGAVQDCSESPGSRTVSDRCYFDDPAGTRQQHSVQEPQYRARGMFFGAEGEYLAIVLMVMPPRPSNPVRLWGDLEGLVILRRSAWK